MDSTTTGAVPADPVRTRVDALGLVVERGPDGTSDGFWAYPPYMGELELPAQGFKLHISATIVNVTEVADRLLPLLVERRAAFKCVSTFELLQHLNQGTWGVTQVGKFMTVYPADDAEAVALARELHDLLHDLEAPEIPSDYPLVDGSLVHYRFGVIAGHETGDPAAPRDTSRLRLPDGSLVPDSRDPRVPVPEWIDDPFREPGDVPAAPAAPFAGRFVVHESLRQRGKGGVYRALEIDPDFVRAVANGEPPPVDADAAALTRPVILKEARRAGEMERSGADAWTRLDWQRRLLDELAPDPRFPSVFDTFELEGSRYLVMEEVQGPSLAAWLLENEPAPEQALAWSRQLVALVRTLHDVGVAWCDVSPDNVILAGPEQTLSAADLEHAVRADGPPFSGIGTPGYYPRAVRPDEANPLVARDLYALGAMLHTLWSGSWFREQASSADGSWERMWDRPALGHGCSAAIRTIIERASSIDTVPIGSVAAVTDPYRSITELERDLSDAVRD